MDKHEEHETKDLSVTDAAREYLAWHKAQQNAFFRLDMKDVEMMQEKKEKYGKAVLDKICAPESSGSRIPRAPFWGLPNVHFINENRGIVRLMHFIEEGFTVESRREEHLVFPRRGAGLCTVVTLSNGEEARSVVFYGTEVLPHPANYYRRYRRHMEGSSRWNIDLPEPADYKR